MYFYMIYDKMILIYDQKLEDDDRFEIMNIQMRLYIILKHENDLI